MKRVAIIHRSIPHYRIRFFELLREYLMERNIELTILYGDSSLKELKKSDTTNISWGIKKNSKIVKIIDRELYFQPFLKEIKAYDMIVLEQASKLLINYYIIGLYSRSRHKIVAYWGHGRNLQNQSRNSLPELIKRVMINSVHWWFAYNSKSVKIVSQAGFPIERITNVENSIDTLAIREKSLMVDEGELKRLKKTLNINSDNIAIFVGGMYEAKRLDFLIESCKIIRDYIPDFHVILIGAGTDESKAVSASERYEWVHYCGPILGSATVPYFMLSKVQLMPGLVGLGIIDSFALGVPLITTNITFHSPEVDYMTDGIDGLIVQDSESPDAYARAVISLLTDEDRLVAMRQAALDKSQRYSIENMARNFAEGIEMALNLRTR